MMTKRIRWVKRVCWLLFVGVCIFHLWHDGRSAPHLEKDQPGQLRVIAPAATVSLCAALNLTALTLLVLIGGLAIVEGKRQKQS
jgi:hypothetical protein